MQRVEVHVGVPSGGYGFKLKAIYQVDNKLIAIAKISTPTGGATASLAFHRDMAVVHTGSSEPLEVVNYLINDKNNYEQFKIHDYISINSKDDIKDLHSKGRLLYQQRFDRLNALRLKQFESGNADTNKLTFPARQCNAANIDTKSILNIYSEIDRGFIKLVFESIAIDDNRYGGDICGSVDSIARLAKEVISIEDDMCMVRDDTYSFKAICKGELTKFKTSAIEVYLPLSKSQTVLYFMLMLDATIDFYKRKESDTGYSHVQISRQSILACFDDLIIDSASYFGYPTIINEMSQSMEEFLSKPGTLHAPDSIANHVLFAISNNNNLSGYESLQRYLCEFYQEFGHEAVHDLSHYLGLIYELQAVYYSSVDIDKNLKLMAELESLLANDRYFHLLAPFIKGFKENLTNVLLEVPRYNTYNNNQFDWKCAEFEFMRNADYYQFDNGKMSISLEGKPADAAFINNIKRLAGELKLSFDESNDFQHALVFTKESSQKLRAYGLHINKINVRHAKADTELHLAEIPVYLSLPVVEDVPVKTTVQYPDEPAFAILRDAGIYSESARKLLLANPVCEEIICIMRKGNIFGADVAKNKNIFARLIQTSQFLLEDRSQTHRPRNDSINSLVNVYRCLAGSSMENCLLTEKANNTILSIIPVYDKLSEIANTLQALQPLNDEMVGQLFSEPMAYLACRKIIRNFDASNESLLLLFGAGVKAADVTKCCRALEYPKPTWLSKDTFKALVANMSQCENVIKGFAILHEQDMLESHREQFLRNPAIAKTLVTMSECYLLNHENIAQSMENPIYAPAVQAINLCCWLNLIYRHQDSKKLLTVLLEHQEMIPLLIDLGKRAKKAEYKERETFSLLFKDLNNLLKSTGVEFRRDTFSLEIQSDKTPKLFKPAEPMKLEDCVKQLQDKYAIASITPGSDPAVGVRC